MTTAVEALVRTVAAPQAQAGAGPEGHGAKAGAEFGTVLSERMHAHAGATASGGDKRDVRRSAGRDGTGTEHHAARTEGPSGARRRRRAGRKRRASASLAGSLAASRVDSAGVTVHRVLRRGRPETQGGVGAAGGTGGPEPGRKHVRTPAADVGPGKRLASRGQAVVPVEPARVRSEASAPDRPSDRVAARPLPVAAHRRAPARPASSDAGAPSPVTPRSARTRPAASSDAATPSPVTPRSAPTRPAPSGEGASSPLPPPPAPPVAAAAARPPRTGAHRPAPSDTPGPSPAPPPARPGGPAVKPSLVAPDTTGDRAPAAAPTTGSAAAKRGRVWRPAVRAAHDGQTLSSGATRPTPAGRAPVRTGRVTEGTGRRGDTTGAPGGVTQSQPSGLAAAPRADGASATAPAAPILTPPTQPTSAVAGQVTLALGGPDGGEVRATLTARGDQVTARLAAPGAVAANLAGSLHELVGALHRQGLEPQASVVRTDAPAVAADAGGQGGAYARGDGGGGGDRGRGEAERQAAAFSLDVRA